MTITTGSTTSRNNDPRPLLDSAIATGGDVISGVRPDQLSDPTPCSEMDVRTMLGHLVAVLGRIAALGNGEDPFGVTETIRSDDGWSDAWTSAAALAVGAWSDDAALERPISLPWFNGRGADVLTTYLSELTVHTWDLATATGQQPSWDDAVVTEALRGPQVLPAENRLALFEQISAASGLDVVAIPFAEAVVVPEDAPAIEQLVAWNGRDPRG